MAWDTAAGLAALEAVDGSVRTLDGARLGYGKPGFANPDFIARGSDGSAKLRAHKIAKGDRELVSVRFGAPCGLESDIS